MENNLTLYAWRKHLWTHVHNNEVLRLYHVQQISVREKKEPKSDNDNKKSTYQWNIHETSVPESEYRNFNISNRNDYRGRKQQK